MKLIDVYESEGNIFLVCKYNGKYAKYNLGNEAEAKKLLADYNATIDPREPEEKTGE